MKWAARSEWVAGLGGAKWAVHERAKSMQRQGQDPLILTIGEPDRDLPKMLLDTAIGALHAGRVGYSEGQGEPTLRTALAAKYSRSTGRDIAPDQVLCVPGTQTALFLAMQGVLDPGDEILVGDPLYATYEAVIRATGATMVPVPLSPDHGFRLQAKDIEANLSERSTAILLNTPHNPTGAILSRDDILAIGEIATANDLWIVCDEVYQELIFDGQDFASPLAQSSLAERCLILSSISKSHAAAGFRSGWVIASKEAIQRLLPLAEAMLFGNQPFIADVTAAAVAEPSPIAADMRRDYARRAELLRSTVSGHGLTVNRPQAGMFALIDIAVTGMPSDVYADDLLTRKSVAVMPGTSFGKTLQNWVRVSLTTPDEILLEAGKRIRDHALSIAAEKT